VFLYGRFASQRVLMSVDLHPRKCHCLHGLDHAAGGCQRKARRYQRPVPSCWRQWQLVTFRAHQVTKSCLLSAGAGFARAVNSTNIGLDPGKARVEVDHNINILDAIADLFRSNACDQKPLNSHFFIIARANRGCATAPPPMACVPCLGDGQRHELKLSRLRKKRASVMLLQPL
jgi:hypothetical protein